MAIAKLGNGIEGWGDYSAGNNGGWHFSSYIDAVGGTMVNNSGAAPTANFDNANGIAILQALHTLRFTDNAMSATQGLAWGTLQQQFAAGKLGMYIAAPDDVYNVIVPTDKGNLSDIGMGPLPSLTGTAGGLAVRRQRLHVRQARHPGADQGRHQVDRLRGPDPRRRPVQLRQAEGGRVPGRLPRARAVQRRRPATKINQLRTPVRHDQHVVLHAVRQREGGRRRRADRRPGRLQDARPGHARGADRAERQHPDAAQDGGGQRQRDPGEQRG